ncbi:MAG: hypothetical protein L3J93_05580 [Thermoplasmata archaeon]|nr:hypothetical protein [Thermoplasmata archaeon]
MVVAVMAWRANAPYLGRLGGPLLVGLLALVLSIPVAAASAGSGPAQPRVIPATAAGEHLPGRTDTGPAPAVLRDAQGPHGTTFGFSVSILLPGSSVDPSRPFNLSALPLGGLLPYRFSWVDSLGATGSGASVAFDAPASGELEIGLRAFDGLNDSATANATVGIGDAPSLSLSAGLPATDVGRPIPITIGVAGSFPPFSLAWQPLPGSPSGSSILPEPGTIDVAAMASVPGYQWFRATVSDRYGATAQIQAVVAAIHALPTLFLTATRGEVDAGASAYLAGLVSDGTPPFEWAAATSLPALNVTGATGRVGASEPIDWSGRFLSEGNATVRFEVHDAAGVPLTANETIRVFPALSVALAIPTDDPSALAPLNLSVDLGGGVAPYYYSLALSDGEAVKGVERSAGPFDWIASPRSPGYLVIRLAVTDALEGSSTSVETISIGAATAAASAAPHPPEAPADPARISNGGSSASWGSIAGLASSLGVAAIATAVGIVVVRRYLLNRRRPATVVPRVDEVLERLLEGSGGIERAVLTLLTQDEGIGAPETDAAIRRLNAAGKLRIEAVTDGSEMLHWNPPAGSVTPEREPA